MVPPADNLDDEIAASVYENRGRMPDVDSFPQLTSDNFHDVVARSSLTVALFYFKCKTPDLGRSCIFAQRRREKFIHQL